MKQEKREKQSELFGWNNNKYEQKVTKTSIHRSMNILLKHIESKKYHLHSQCFYHLCTSLHVTVHSYTCLLILLFFFRISLINLELYLKWLQRTESFRNCTCVCVRTDRALISFDSISKSKVANWMRCCG